MKYKNLKKTTDIFLLNEYFFYLMKMHTGFNNFVNVNNIVHAIKCYQKVYLLQKYPKYINAMGVLTKPKISFFSIFRIHKLIIFIILTMEEVINDLLFQYKIK